MYTPAEQKLRASLQVDPYYLPALSDMAMLLYRQVKYGEALGYAKTALSIDTYDPAANYYYGLINERLGNYIDARDGYDIATQSAGYRTAAYTRLSALYFRQQDLQKAKHYAEKAVSSNAAALDALQLLALIYRVEKNKEAATIVLDTIKKIDPLNHFSNFENWLWDSSAANKKGFAGMVRNEMPGQTFLELAIWYHNAGRNNEAIQVLSFADADAETECWRAYLTGRQPVLDKMEPGLVSPFRQETAEILQSLMQNNDHWMLKYFMGLIHWNSNSPAEARKLLDACGTQPAFAPFYLVRAKLYMHDDSLQALSDIKKAASLDADQWRYDRALINYYISTAQPAAALTAASSAYKKNTANYIVAMLYAKALMLNKQYAAADKLIKDIQVLPNEGSTAGRELYREAKLRLAASEIKLGNCRKAQQYISDARLWPERLGSGKPYQEDIDERLEDWLQYKCVAKSSTVQASALLDKIIRFTESRNGKLPPTLNNLVAAFAYIKKGREAEGKKLLAGIRDKYPENPVARWMPVALEDPGTPVPPVVNENEIYQLLRDSGALTK